MSLAESTPRFFMGAQVFSVLLLSLLLWVFKGGMAGYSAVLGGITVILPNFYFARRLFAQTGAQAMNKIVRAFYVGEAMKLALTIGLCFLIFKLIPVAMLPFFIAFIIAQAVVFLVPLIDMISSRYSACHVGSDKAKSNEQPECTSST